MDEESEQVQKLYNLDENQTALQFLVLVSYADITRASTQDAMDHLNL